MSEFGISEDAHNLVLAVHDAALTACQLGISVVPPRNDGTKAPIGAWKRFQSERASEDLIDSWFDDDYTGLGFVCGEISGGLQMFEFEGRAVSQGMDIEFLEIAAATGLEDLISRLTSGYTEETPSGGLHWLFRCPEPLTERLAQSEDGSVLIETKGEGGYVVVSPSGGSVHPTGRPWKVRSGALASIPTITPGEQSSLHALARSLDRRRALATETPRTRLSRRERTVADEFALSISWEELLTPHGWSYVVTTKRGHQHWRRPGKESGTSATVSDNGNGLLYIFTSSTQFEPERCYNKLTASAVLNHGGNVGAAIRGHEASSALDKNPLDGVGYVRMCDVSPQKVEWLWPGRIPIGKLTILEGDPKTGKSTVALDLAARVSTGSAMPDGPKLPKARRVLLMTAEDGLGDTVRPRLDAAGADSSNVLVWESVPATDTAGVFGHIRPPSLPQDLPTLEALIREHDASLVVIDVLNAFLGGDVDGYRDADVRRALMPLAKVAERTQAAIVVIRHLSKSGGPNPMYRGGGSIGIGAAARSILLAGADPEDEAGVGKVLAVTACNVSVPFPALRYHLVPDDTHGCARVEWDGASPLTSADLLSAPATSDERNTRHEARSWLENLLAGGSLSAKEAKRQWRNTGMGSDSTLDRARRDLGIKPTRSGFGPGAEYRWEMPGHGSHSDLTSMSDELTDEDGYTSVELGEKSADDGAISHARQSMGTDAHVEDMKIPTQISGLIDGFESPPLVEPSSDASTEEANAPTDSRGESHLESLARFRQSLRSYDDAMRVWRDFKDAHRDHSELPSVTVLTTEELLALPDRDES